MSRRLRDELNGMTHGEAAASEVVTLWDEARPEDWIAQLEEVNRALLAENRRLLAEHGLPAARRLA